jgi:hypothetical protein
MFSPLNLWIQKLIHLHTQLLKINRLSNVTIKPRLHALGIHISKNVGTERDDGEVLVFVLAFPAADVLASLVAVFVGHVEVALKKSRGLVGKGWEEERQLTKMIE